MAYTPQAAAARWGMKCETVEWGADVAVKVARSNSCCWRWGAISNVCIAQVMVGPTSKAPLVALADFIPETCPLMCESSIRVPDISQVGVYIDMLRSSKI